MLFLCASVLAALLAVSGCGGDVGKYPLDGLLNGGGQKDASTEMALDPNDADRRRSAIVSMSQKPWGRREPYTKCYAAALAGDDDALVRAAAAGALGRVGDPNYLPALVSALKDRFAEVRLDAANALDLLTGEAAVEPLRKSATEDASVDVRAACARALRHYRRKEVGQTLLKCLDDDAFEVRHQSHATLTELTGNDAGITGEEWRDLLDREPLTQPLPSRPWWDLLKK